MSVDLPEVHARALDNTRTIVAGVQRSQFGDPTPCEDWDVATLLHHIIYGNFWVSPLVSGETIEQVGDRLEGDLLGDDFVAAYDRSSADCAAAFRAPGAMDGTVCGVLRARSRQCLLRSSSDRRVGARVGCRQGDRWEHRPARGSGRRVPRGRGASARHARGLGRSTGDNWDVPADATPQTRLLRLLGRTP